jgi:hypothetical protein
MSIHRYIDSATGYGQSFGTTYGGGDTFGANQCGDGNTFGDGCGGSSIVAQYRPLYNTRAVTTEDFK